MATTDTRAALERLYLEAYRAGVEAAGDTVGGSPRNTIWAARDRLVGTARQYLMDEGEWADSDSPLAQALALSAPEERGEGEHEGMDAATRLMTAETVCPFCGFVGTIAGPYHDCKAAALASPPAPVEGERGEIRDLSSEIHFADGMDDDVAPAPAVAQGAEEARIERQYFFAHEALDELGAPTSGGPGRRRRYTLAGRIRALARPIAGSEERERIRQIVREHMDEHHGGAWEGDDLLADKILAALRGQEAEDG